MLMSSVVPQNQDLSSEETVNKVKRQVVTDDNSKQFEDTSDDLPEDSTKDEGSVSDSRSDSRSDIQDDQNVVEHDSTNTSEENEEEAVKTESQNDSEKSVEGNQQEMFIKESSEGNEERNGNTNSEAGETNESEQQESDNNSSKIESETDQNEKNMEREESDDESKQRSEASKQNDDGNMEESQEKSEVSNESFSAGAQSELLQETTAQNGAWSTQAAESQNEKESIQTSASKYLSGHSWKVCNATAGPDYIPCLDNWQAIKKLTSRSHYQHRERHCPVEPPTCLVPLPEGYKRSIKWPTSRDKVS